MAAAGRIAFVEQAPLPKNESTTGASHAVLWRGLAGDGSIEAEARPTGIELTPAGEGMGLCDAVGTSRGAQVLWFAAAPPLEQGGKSVPQARLLAAALDEAGSLVEGSELELLQGEIGFGHITGHTRPRLLASASRALYLVRAPEGGAAGASRWLGLRFGPAGQTTLKPSSLVVELDPWLLASGRSLTGPELGRLRRLDALEPSRLLGQPARDAERLAWLGDDGFFVTGGTLTRIDRSYEHTEALAHPFVARRSRLRWARLEPDGSGLGALPTGYAELTGAGELRQLGGVPAPDLDAARVSRLKGRWLALVAAAGGARLIELPSGRALGGALAVDPHAATLVGGAEEGWLVAVIGGAMTTIVAIDEPPPARSSHAATASTPVSHLPFRQSSNPSSADSDTTTGSTPLTVTVLLHSAMHWPHPGSDAAIATTAPPPARKDRARPRAATARPGDGGRRAKKWSLPSFRNVEVATCQSGGIPGPRELPTYNGHPRGPIASSHSYHPNDIETATGPAVPSV